MRAVQTARTPLESHKALYSLGKRIQEDDDDKKQYTQKDLEGVVEAAHALAAQMLGLRASTTLGSSSSSSTRSASSTINSHVSSSTPVLQLNSKQLSLTVWAFSQLVSADSRVRSRRLRELVDTIAAHAVRSSIMDEPADKACMQWSMLLYGMAKMGFGCKDIPAVQQVFEAGAKRLPQILHRRQRCVPQDVSNSLWAFAAAEYGGSLQQLVSGVASSLGWVMKNAKPHDWSQAVWALATLHSQKVMLGEQSTVSKIVSAGVEGVVQQRWKAVPQDLSNTLWALGTLDLNPGNATINTLATAMVDRSSTAKPQELSNALHGLGSLRWYQPEVYSKLVGRLLTSISSTCDAIGQHFSNALFSCALSCHFDSSVDALAAWGSQQDLQQWTEQHVSNSLFAWAALTAAAGGDTAHMRALAQNLFKEADRKGATRFTVGNDLGKLYGAHLEAVHLGLPGGGLTDSTLLQAVQKDTAKWRQEIGMQQRHNANAVTLALQGHFEVQAAMVQGYHTLLVPHNSHRIAIEVTQHDRDYLNHPAGQLYGKNALRLKHVERGCVGLVLCDESALEGSSIKQQREMLVQRIEQVLGFQKQV